MLTYWNIALQDFAFGHSDITRLTKGDFSSPLRLPLSWKTVILGRLFTLMALIENASIFQSWFLSVIVLKREDKMQLQVAAHESTPSYLTVWGEAHILLPCIQTQDITLPKGVKSTNYLLFAGLCTPAFLGTINNYTQRPGERNLADKRQRGARWGSLAILWA